MDRPVEREAAVAGETGVGLVIAGMIPWAWPLCLALAASAWQAWPASFSTAAGASLALAVLSAWCPHPGWALGAAAAAIATGLSIRPRFNWSAAVGMPTLVLALLRARVQWLPILPDGMAFWAGLLALIGVCMAGQGLLAAQSSIGLSLGLVAGQTCWAAFGMVTGTLQAPMAWVGLVGLIWQQPLMRQPLQDLLSRQPPPPVATALLLLGLGGCLGLSGFSAYFQLFVPLMAQGDGVADMHAKLFSGAGLLAAVAMLAVLVQTCAFGYVYWLRVLPRTEEPPEERPWPARVWPWLALGLSLAWGLSANTVSGHGLAALQAIKPQSPFP